MREELITRQSSEIRGMFGRISHRYDLLNRLLSLGRDRAWRVRLARRVADGGGGRVLDVCTGTGDVALALDGASEVLGTDFCLPMLRIAHLKAESAGRRLPLFAADALQLPLADGVFDAVTVAFGVRNFERLAAGLAELIRVLRPGGTLAVLEFSRPRGPLGPLLGWWAREVPPRLGRLLSGDDEAYSYLPASVDSFPDTGEMCRSLAGAGLIGVRAQRLTGGVATLYDGRRAS